MATNKFATMLHTNTNKFTLILVYVLLEWTLIAILLLNSLLSCLIIKFANYFGLKPPCFWCSTIDHFLQPQKGDNFRTDLLCEAHANQISKLGYCRNHQKLVAYQDMCEDCSSSRPDFCGVSKNFTVFSWVEDIEMIHDDAEKVVDDGVLSFKCSCCDVSLEKQVYSPHVLECTQKENLILNEEGNDHVTKKDDFSDRTGSDILVDHFEEDHRVESNEEHMVFGIDGGYRLIEGKDEEDSDCSVSVSKFGLEELKGGDDDEVEMLLQEESDHFEEDDLSKVMEDLISDDIMSQACPKEDASMKIHPEHLEFFVDFSGHQLVPVELVDFNTEENGFIRAEENQSNSELHEKCSPEFGLVARVETSVVEETKFTMFESMEMEETENSLVFYAKENYSEYQNVDRSVGAEETENSMPLHAKETFTEYEIDKRFTEFEETGNSLGFHAKERYSDDEITLATHNSILDFSDPQGIATIEGIEMESSFTPMDCEDVSDHVQSKISELDDLVGVEIAGPDEHMESSYLQTVPREESDVTVNETEVEVSIGTEIPDLESTDETQAQDTICLHEDPFTRSDNLHEDDHEHGMEIKLQQEEALRLGNLAIEISENMTNKQISVSTESNGIDEEKVPDTPTSLDGGFHHLRKKLLLLDGKESGTEESLDGSVTEFESGDGATTVERLTSALKAERQALHVLYAELEEERSASAVSANQTMAMINRLQEEKAAMQMEALQYQRMMEEQSEYDQEALQLLNELMLKREREKRELEIELDMYQKKVMDYEAKEKMRMLRRSKDGSARSGFSSTSFSNGEDSDGISIDLNQEGKGEDGFYSNQESGSHKTPVKAVQHLGDSFGEFEEERMSILEQLKVLEDKLFTLSEDEHQYEEVRSIKQFSHSNGNHLDGNSDFNGEEVNGLANCYSKATNGIHHREERFMGAKAKRLLPLFDAITAEHENVELNGNENSYESVVTRFELEERRVAIEEEVDQLYARMHALETDKEFLKHCISSLKKGDKGLDLLQEILQHLRDLRSMELHVKNFTDGTLV